MKILYLFFLSIIASNVFSNQSFEPRDTYFNVYRNDSLIGYHKLNFFSNEKEITANIEIKFEVTFLGFVEPTDLEAIALDSLILATALPVFPEKDSANVE